MIVSLVALAWADEPAVIAVLPGLLGSDEARIRAALEDAGFPAAVLLPPDEFVSTLDVVSVTALDEEGCGGPVGLAAWKDGVAAARARTQLLDFRGALGEFVQREVELACLTAPLAASDLFRLELSLAESHWFLAQAASGDASARAFHAEEAAHALERAAIVGKGLATPGDLEPDVVAAFDAARGRLDAATQPRVLVAGPGARVGARFNGRPLPEGPFTAFPGDNLVQAAAGPVVTAAATVELKGNTRTLLWLSPGGTPRTEGDVVREVIAHSRGQSTAEGRALLASAARLLETTAPVVFIRLPPTGDAEVWGRDGGELVRLGEPVFATAEAAAPGGPWRVSGGLGGSGGWTSLDPVVGGLGGPHGGPSAWMRVGLSDGVTLALTVHPDVRAHPIPDELGGGTLFQATVPARAGVRFGRRTGGAAPEVGVDVGAQYFGVFDDAPRASFLAVGTAGLSAGMGRIAAVRLEAWGGVGLGYGVGGAYLGVEWRN